MAAAGNVIARAARPAARPSPHAVLWLRTRSSSECSRLWETSRLGMLFRDVVPSLRIIATAIGRLLAAAEFYATWASPPPRSAAPW